MTTSRDAILEALRTRSLPEASECLIFETESGWDCSWPIQDEEACEFPIVPFWGYGPTPAAAHSALCEKIEHALKENK